MTIQTYATARAHLLGTAALGALLVAIAAPAHARDATAAPDALAAADADTGADGSGTEIRVTGQRRGTVAAIEEKRAAIGVIDVIAADELGKLPDPNVADALGRIPGVSVIVNQDTGEGEYVTIRGLSGTYNAVSINGVRVAQTDPNSRDVSLNVLPPNGLAAIRVTKTLTPDQDGDAIGGSIDFRTPTAFDFTKPTLFRIYGSGGINQQAKKAGEDYLNYQAQADLGRRFGDDRFGIFASANYGVSHSNGQETENDGEWEPYKYRANSEEAIDQRTMHLPGIDLDYRRIRQTRYGGNISFDYHGDRTQLYLRGQYARQQLRGTNDVTDYRNRPTARLTQVNVDDTALVQPDAAVTGTGAKGRIYSYTTRQIVDRDGDGLITDADRGGRGYWSLNGRSGVWNPQAFQFARNFGTIDQNQTLGTIDAGGSSSFGRLTLDYDASYSGGTRTAPRSYSIGYNCDACTYPLNATGIDWVASDPHFPQAGLPAFAQAVERTSRLLPFDGASSSESRQKDSRIAARLDAHYAVGGVLDYVKAGAKFTRSKRNYDYTPIFDGDLAGTPLDGRDLAASGLVDKSVNSILGGRYYYGDVLSRAAVERAIQAAQAANPQDYDEADLLQDDRRSTEKVYAAYALAGFKVDALQVITGARFERRETRNIFWVDDGDASRFDTTDKGYNKVLPSITAVYRPDARQVYRAAVWTAYSPPEYGNLAGGSSVTRDPTTNEVLAISRGNPDLKAASAINADLSAEYYVDRSSIVSVGGFYKRIKNFIFTNGSQVTADTQQGTIEISQPQNGQSATIYGAELSLIKSFEGLVPPFDGFGVEGNLTVQRSRAETGIPYRAGNKIRFVNTPHLLYNAALTYQKFGVEAKLSYTYRGKYIESLRDNAVDKWVQHSRSLDLHTRYNVTKQVSIDFDVGNILNDYKYYTTKGDNVAYLKDYLETGRTFLLRGSYTF